MYKLLHIHNNVTFAWDSNKFLNENLNNEILFIGDTNEELVARLKKLPITFKIFNKTDVNTIIKYANQFDGIVFYNLDEIKVQILLHINSKIKTFLRFFGYELYGIRAENFLSVLTWSYEIKPKASFLSTVKMVYHFLKRKLKVALNEEYLIKADNQKVVYRKLDAVLMINEFEYNELSKLFYLPKLIELQFTNHENETHEFKVFEQKENKIIIGNSGSRWNNHIDILNIISNHNNMHSIEFKLFFSYGTESIYSQNVKRIAEEIENVSLIEDFLKKDEFEAVYSLAAALVINSYRQHAVGNIITAIKYGCKIYLSDKSSTYHWLTSKGFIIAEIDDLAEDIKIGNIKLKAEEQQKNFDCFLSVIKKYSVDSFVNNVLTVLKN